MSVHAFPTPDVPSVRERVSDAEWETRIELAQLYRIMASLGTEELTYNHFAARVKDNPEHFLIKPTALMFSEVTASNLCCYHLDGHLVHETEHTSSPAGYLIHGSILAARPDVGCTMHQHTEATVAVSAVEGGLRFISQESMRFHGKVGYHRYEGLVHEDEECPRLVRDLADNKVLFLENHGTLVTGRTVPECFLLFFFLERACRIQMTAMASGAKLKEPPEEMCAEARLGWAENRTGNHNRLVGDRDFQAMVRRIDAMDQSYRS
jgi:ribulose-5-phosphate 4-epimerase/fuculose-1-phosphate aldolase